MSFRWHQEGWETHVLQGGQDGGTRGRVWRSGGYWHAIGAEKRSYRTLYGAKKAAEARLGRRRRVWFMACDVVVSNERGYLVTDGAPA